MSRGPCLFQDVGREGIRTLGMLSHAPIFEIGTLNHSVTPPFVDFQHSQPRNTFDAHLQ